MIFRFLIVWTIISILVGIWIYYFSNEERKNLKRFFRGVAFSMFIGSLILAALMFINNISGV